jgi:hypothetical protein
MPFSNDRLSVVAYADGFTLWHYRGTPDTQAAIGAIGYFAPVAHMVRAGDLVIAGATDGTALMALSGTGAALRASAI